MALDTKKLMKNESSLKGEGSIIVVEEKLITVKKLLGERVKIKRGERKRERRQDATDKRQQDEQELESSTPKFSIKKFANFLPRLSGGGILDWFKNFVVLTFAGWLIKNIRSFLPALESFFNKTLPGIGRMMDGFVNFLNGPVLDFIGGAYKLYDDIGDTIGKYLGEDWKKKFEDVSNKLKTVITGAIGIAALNLIAGGQILKWLKWLKFWKRKPNLNLQPPSTKQPFLKRVGNLFRRINPFKRTPTTRQLDLPLKVNPSKPGFMQNLLKRAPQWLQRFRIPVPSWLRKGGGPIIGTLLAGWNLMERIKNGQELWKAMLGVGSEITGGTLAAAAMAKTASPLLVTPIPGARILYAVLVFGAGIAGMIGGGGLMDSLTGVNDAQIKVNEKDQASVGSSKIIPIDIASLNNYTDYEGFLEVRYNYIQPILQDA